jgi:flagellar biogenesis protein FliO
MTTSASGWPKLSHRRFRLALWLLVLSGGVVIAAGRADGQSQSRDPYQAEDANAPPIVRRTASPAVAETVSSPVEPAPVTRHKTWKDLVRTRNEDKSRETHAATLSPWTAVSALAVVVCLILVLARIFRRHAPRFSQALPTEALEVLGRRFLDQRQSIVLLRIGSRILVVGSSTAGLQGLGELTDPIEVDLIAGLCRGTRNGPGLGGSFLSLLKGQVGPPSKPARRAEPPRRAQPAMPDSSVDDELPSARLSDAQHELMRRLRGISTAAVPHAGGSEVFRD